MHHRVKNNLQTVAMLLRLQLRDGREVSGREVLTETITRILSIAAVHEILSAEGFRLVNLRQLLDRVAHNVTQTMAAPALRLAVTVTGEDIYLNSRQATSLALVVNELLQNAIEHAFPDRTEGRVEIRLSKRDGELVLMVEDDGRGLPPGFEPLGGDDLGLKIIHALVTEDLGGSITFSREAGTRAVISIPRVESRA